jgi:hypothetical protein
MTQLAKTEYWQGDDIVWTEPFSRVFGVGDSVWHDDRWYRVQEITIHRDVLMVRLFARRRI